MFDLFRPLAEFLNPLCPPKTGGLTDSGEFSIRLILADSEPGFGMTLGAAIW